MDQTLRDYIDSARASGASDDDILGALVGSGWDKGMVLAGLEQSASAGHAMNPVSRTSDAVTGSQGPIRLYDPHGYATITFFLGIVPAAVMSLSNSRFLEGGDALRRAMKRNLIVYLSLVALSLFLTFVSAWYVAREGRNAIATNPSRAVSRESLGASLSGPVAAAKAFNETSGYLLFGINLALMVATVRMTNRMEAPAYDALKKAGSVKKRGVGLPALAGLIFVGAILLLNAPLQILGVALGLAR